ncbi:MAG: hypothetical protein DMF56_04500 [Acidobacteria bacterium]|nr:MAG: hypothetical protein DMF56_04500 [Acidobacteriota bacterium]
MTEQPPEADLSRDDEEPSAPMPRWIPIFIGVVLVTLAALAVYTGLRFRSDDTILAHVPARKARPTAPAPGGEPGAGASLVLPENTPVANEPVPGTSRTVITNDSGGVQATSRYWARRGVVFNVLPDDVLVYVNDLPIGQVTQFNSMDEVYDFAEPGSYNVKLVAPNGAEKLFVVTAADDAKQDIARITWKF